MAITFGNLLTGYVHRGGVWTHVVLPFVNNEFVYLPQLSTFLIL